MTVRIISCTAPAALHCRFQGQSSDQRVFIELDLAAGTLLADYDSEVGSAVPHAVRHGIERRYPIPALTADAANRLLRRLLPHAVRMHADWCRHWDGHNWVAALGPTAREAEAEIRRILRTHNAFDDADLITVCDIDVAVNGLEADEYDITAATTDERLAEVAQQIIANLAESSPSTVVVCPGLDVYLRDLRKEQCDADDCDD
ncbi:hypothetical protein ACIQNG_25740 [Streptomyces sp. NPDC091377]|uniref:hypothetical protein n=1 Tax=Streptomyces sp. NPDC091377 TaxID=3365995 RepID=UPI00381521B6